MLEVLDYGVDNIGRTFVIMERIYGITLENIGKECRMPLLGQKAYVSYRECKIYADTAHANTNSFITNHVLP